MSENYLKDGDQWLCPFPGMIPISIQKILEIQRQQRFTKITIPAGETSPNKTQNSKDQFEGTRQPLEDLRMECSQHQNHSEADEF